jgi:carboxyvinyl-carboxyphosphonate phosphorylmutase
MRGDFITLKEDTGELRCWRMKKTARLRELIERNEILIAPGAYDAFSAKLIEAVGFDAVYMSGFGTAASTLGVPDIGLLTMSEMVCNSKRIADAVNIPVIADADTGYGNHLNVIRTIEEYERAGIAAVQIEDQVSPKRCGHMEGHKLISADEMAAKIRAAVRARKDGDMVLIARTDAISAKGFEEAIRRGSIYRKAGADVLFIEAPTEVEQLSRIPKLINGPTLVNVAPKTPYLHVKKYEEMGYVIAIYPPISITCVYVALKEKLLELKKDGMNKDGGHGGVDFDELVDFLGLAKYRSIEREVLEE